MMKHLLKLEDLNWLKEMKFVKNILNFTNEIFMPEVSHLRTENIKDQFLDDMFSANGEMMSIPQGEGSASSCNIIFWFRVVNIKHHIFSNFGFHHLYYSQMKNNFFQLFYQL